MKQVLVVEDSPTMRAFLSSALESLDGPVKVSEAQNGFEALRLLPRARLDLIVVDVNMPDINGLELIGYIREHPSHREVPLLMISTEGSDRDREKGLELGADAYLAKPFEAEVLCQVVRDLLDAPGRDR